MADLNIEDKIALIKKHNLSLRLVLFSPIPLLFSLLPIILFIEREIHETLPL